MSDPTQSVCRSCGLPILWTTTANGHALPVDAEPSPQGNLDLRGPTPVVIEPGMTKLYRRLHRAHCVTCPCTTQPDGL